MKINFFSSILQRASHNRNRDWMILTTNKKTNEKNHMKL